MIRRYAESRDRNRNGCICTPGDGILNTAKLELVHRWSRGLFTHADCYGMIIAYIISLWVWSNHRPCAHTRARKARTARVSGRVLHRPKPDLSSVFQQQVLYAHTLSDSATGFGLQRMRTVNVGHAKGVLANGKSL